jgi:hypothetical protein
MVSMDNKKMKETRTIDGVEYKVFLRRVSPIQEKNNVRNRGTLKSNGLDENTNKPKETHKKGIKANNGTTPTRAKKKVNK